MLEVDEKVIADIGRGFTVPAQPELLIKLQKLMAEPEPEIRAIANVISQDIAVSAIILKTINSPIYGLARSISDIQKATRYIGINGITSLVSNILIRKSFNQNDCSIALEEFWFNASNIANTCVVIGKSLKQSVSIEKLFTLGLFLDCGIPVMAMKYKDYAETIEHAGNTPSETFTSIEESIYQVNHATLGYFVASSWRLPKDICQLLLCHHERSFLDINNDRAQKFYFAIVKMAENIVHNHKHFRDSADWAYLQDSVFTLLNIDEDDYQDLCEDSADLQN